MIETDVQVQIDSITSFPVVRFLNEVFPFIFVSLILVWYFLPILLQLWNGRPEAVTTKLLARRLLDASTLTALITGAGWLIGTPVILFGGIALGENLDLRFYLEYFSHSFVLFGFSFIITYYAVETVVPRIPIPRLFKENEVLAVGSKFSLSISARLIVFAGAVFLVPGLMFVITIRILNNGGNNYMDRDLMAIFDWALPILFSLVGIITWLKSLAIHAPITEYQEEACKIGEGHFDTRIMVRSADEIGALGGTLNDMARGLEERERMRSIFKADNVRK